MPSLLDPPIQKPDWQRETREVGEALSMREAARNGNGAISADSDAERWDGIIDEVAAMLQLGDDWDGLGATAPTQELVAFAIGLAPLLNERTRPPLTFVVP